MLPWNEKTKAKTHAINYSRIKTHLSFELDYIYKDELYCVGFLPGFNILLFISDAVLYSHCSDLNEFLHRSLSVSQVKQAVQEAIEMQRKYPDLVAGFDLVITSLTHSHVARMLNTKHVTVCIVQAIQSNNKAKITEPWVRWINSKRWRGTITQKKERCEVILPHFRFLQFEQFIAVGGSWRHWKIYLVLSRCLITPFRNEDATSFLFPCWRDRSVYVAHFIRFWRNYTFECIEPTASQNLHEALKTLVGQNYVNAIQYKHARKNIKSVTYSMQLRKL